MTIRPYSQEELNSYIREGYEIFRDRCIIQNIEPFQKLNVEQSNALTLGISYVFARTLNEQIPGAVNRSSMEEMKVSYESSLEQLDAKSQGAVSTRVFFVRGIKGGRVDNFVGGKLHNVAKEFASKVAKEHSIRIEEQEKIKAILSNPLLFNRAFPPLEARK